jgi:hypothetical protein
LYCEGNDVSDRARKGNSALWGQNWFICRENDPGSSHGWPRRATDGALEGPRGSGQRAPPDASRPRSPLGTPTARRGRRRVVGRATVPQKASSPSEVKTGLFAGKTTHGATHGKGTDGHGYRRDGALGSLSPSPARPVASRPPIPPRDSDRADVKRATTRATVPQREVPPSRVRTGSFAGKSTPGSSHGRPRRATEGALEGPRGAAGTSRCFRGPRPPRDSDRAEVRSGEDRPVLRPPCRARSRAFRGGQILHQPPGTTGAPILNNVLIAAYLGVCVHRRSRGV